MWPKHIVSDTVCILNIRCEITSDKHDTLTGPNLIYLDQISLIKIKICSFAEERKVAFSYALNVYSEISAS